MTAPTQAGASLARLTQGANIRNAPKGGESAKTGSSLPGGTVVTVLECVPNWCKIALPQFPVAWVSRGFLAFDVAAPAPAPRLMSRSASAAQQMPAGRAAAARATPAAPRRTGRQHLRPAGRHGDGGHSGPGRHLLNVRDKPNGTIQR